MPWDWGQELATDPDWRDLVIAEVADKPIGIMQIIDPAEEETHYSGDLDRRGSLYRPRIWGSDDGARAANVLRRIRSGCGLDRSFGGQYPRTQFYERFGIRRIERRRFGTDNCFVYRLDRKDWTARQ